MTLGRWSAAAAWARCIAAGTPSSIATSRSRCCCPRSPPITERLARFNREAQVLASLNHPNIAHIHGLEAERAGPFLVLEFVDGPTLADRIAQGPIPIDEALAIARQIADALEAAHERGVIHRDLKPANIKVSDDGAVKVLDFGLAKAIDQGSGIGDQGSGERANSPTITTPAMTQAGMILGTAAYMSPEQAKGRVVDKRSDVWAFGCVLYEMSTGKRAFDGEDVTDTIAAVVRGEPELVGAAAGIVPPQIRLLLKRCLEKDRRARISDIGVARFLMNESLEMRHRRAWSTRRRESPWRCSRWSACWSAHRSLPLPGRWRRRARPRLRRAVRFDIHTARRRNGCSCCRETIMTSPSRPMDRSSSIARGRQSRAAIAPDDPRHQ